MCVASASNTSRPDQVRALPCAANASSFNSVRIVPSLCDGCGGTILYA